ncbi:MAG: dTDP-4-dehydrorhamnose reductase [Planctomycetota bacterium]
MHLGARRPAQDHRVVPEGSIARVLVTGAGGLMGQALVRAFAGHAQALPKTRAELDVTDARAVAGCLDELHPSAVLNAAAFTDVDAAESRTREAEAVNVTGVRNLAASCAQRGILLVGLGTDYVFDGVLRRPYREDDPPRPLSAYGRSQLAGEHALAEAGGEFLLVRTQGLYGSGRPTLVHRLLAVEDPEAEVRMVADRTSQPSWADEVADAVRELWRCGARGVVHVANTGPLTWYEFTVMLHEESGRPRGRILSIAAAQRSEAAVRPAYSALDTGRYEALTGRRLRGVREALRAFLQQEGVTRG